jgi:hypothetical protein
MTVTHPIDTVTERPGHARSRSCHYCASGRRPFSTKGGRIGLGHRSIKAGDMVCIFKTAPVPLVLRPPSLAGESEHGAYTLVGEAYVHGIMNGEAFFMAAQENILEQCFTIA